MKIKIKSYNAVASWRWNIQPKDKKDNDTVGDESKSKADLSDLDAEVDEDDDDDEEEDVCGICRVAFEGTCPNCKIPGDDCPLSRSLYSYTELRLASLTCCTISFWQMHAYCKYEKALKAVSTTQALAVVLTPPCSP